MARKTCGLFCFIITFCVIMIFDQKAYSQDFEIARKQYQNGTKIGLAEFHKHYTEYKATWRTAVALKICGQEKLAYKILERESDTDFEDALAKSYKEGKINGFGELYFSKTAAIYARLGYELGYEEALQIVSYSNKAIKEKICSDALEVYYAILNGKIK